VGASRNLWAGVAILALGLGTWLLLRSGGHEPTATPMPDEAAIEALPPGALMFQTVAGERNLADGAVVAANEAVRFRVQTTQRGYLLIARIDRLGGTHLVYPTGQGGRSAPVQPSETQRDLGQTLTGLTGPEHLVAVLCQRPFVFDSLRDRLRADRPDVAPLPGCAWTYRQLTGP